MFLFGGSSLSFSKRGDGKLGGDSLVGLFHIAELWYAEGGLKQLRHERYAGTVHCGFFFFWFF